MIKPGDEIEGATADLAVAALAALLADAHERAKELDVTKVKYRAAHIEGAPVRDPAADAGGWFAWRILMSDGREVPVLIPGVDLNKIRGNLSAAAPRIGIGTALWWWTDAVASLADEGAALRPELVSPKAGPMKPSPPK
ncbi:hypothetical protein J2S43_001129 [Catenuloplanes nepalensis]|uniref:Uncharacterized protein n=1 Tax=Catenuloplanes nepalensis TaxID=587533 RepID=A0ABT9MMH9_9ACTN|nr:hypothetical protein [Catenuloplanes nepalensis]MDP9792617.1 hypothetical protein [Catenuloplanes nepalensis]